MKNFNPVRGTYDYMPTDAKIREIVRGKILSTFQNNGYNLIGTPIFEHLELLNGSDGGDNLKLMFKTIKRGDKLDLSKPNLTENDIVEEGLRYDLTVPLVRFFANNKEKLPAPFKAIQIDESFRAERPQRGRIRQFTQCDIDILGDSSPLCEVELLYAYMCSYKKLGFNKLTFKINDRRVLNGLIVGVGIAEEKITDVCISLDKLDKIGTTGVSAELEQNGYEKAQIKKLMSIFETLKQAGSNAEKLEILSKVGINEEVLASLKLIIETAEKFVFEGYSIVYDATVIRGQGYYTGTVFEVFDDDFGRAIGGGGRYDKMIEKFLGVSIPAVGCSIGLYPVAMLMVERGYYVPSNKLALVYDKKESYENIMAAKIALMNKGFDVAIFAFPKNFNNFAERLKMNGYKKLVKMQNLENIIDL